MPLADVCPNSEGFVILPQHSHFSLFVIVKKSKIVNASSNIPLRNKLLQYKKINKKKH